MNAFDYQNPVKVVFGLGVITRMGVETAKLGKRALVVSYADHGALMDVVACNPPVSENELLMILKSAI